MIIYYDNNRDSISQISLSYPKKNAERMLEILFSRSTSNKFIEWDMNYKHSEMRQVISDVIFSIRNKTKADIKFIKYQIFIYAYLNEEYSLWAEKKAPLLFSKTFEDSVDLKSGDMMYIRPKDLQEDFFVGENFKAEKLYYNRGTVDLKLLQLQPISEDWNHEVQFYTHLLNLYD